MKNSLKIHYVMEFLQIQPDTHVYEEDLEQALIIHPSEILTRTWQRFLICCAPKKIHFGRARFLY